MRDTYDFKKMVMMVMMMITVMMIEVVYEINTCHGFVTLIISSRWS